MQIRQRIGSRHPAKNPALSRGVLALRTKPGRAGAGGLMHVRFELR
jgi:hypothetical protein